LKNTLKNTKKGITKEQHITQSAFRWEGGTVENTLKTKHKESQRAAHHSIPAFIGRNWVGLLKNTLRETNSKKSQRAASLPAFIGGVGRTVEKYS
jgi:hypothetical protein